MNESTLVPRQEMSDLDWLARNVHEWPEQITRVYSISLGKFCDFFPTGTKVITKQQWLARRAELQNKPSWNDWPKRKFMAQNKSGCWIVSDRELTAGDDGRWHGYGGVTSRGTGEVLGDWRDTLEKRPEQAEFEPFFSVEDAATAKQPAPKGSGNPILGMVLADLTNRALEGKKKYGEPLLAHNGRNPLWDAYQEALDLAMYLRQAIEEQKQ